MSFYEYLDTLRDTIDDPTHEMRLELSQGLFFKTYCWIHFISKWFYVKWFESHSLKKAYNDIILISKFLDFRYCMILDTLTSNTYVIGR